MSRFKVSKFKNAFCVTPKRELWITDVRIGSPMSCGQHIKASGAFMAYCNDSPGGGSLGVLDVTTTGRQTNPSILFAHSALVTDFDFSPFNDYLLATGSLDKSIKVWELPEGGETEGLSPICTFQGGDKRVENVVFHPTASDIVTASMGTMVKIYDIAQQAESLAVEVSTDQLQGISWKQDGTLLATTARDKKLRIVDPREKTVPMETNGHGNIRDSRICWLGNGDVIISTGFDSRRSQELRVWDVRNFTSSVSSSTLGTATGILMPLYDPDTEVLFLACKGGQTIGMFEIQNGGTKISTGLTYGSELQQKGACLVPKKVLDVMECEVGRILQMTNKGIIPLKVEVPRTSHVNFYPELFPDTAGSEAALTAAQWLAGENGEVAKVSLDPAKRKDMPKKPANQQPASDSPANQSEGGGGDAAKVESKEVPKSESTTPAQSSTPPPAADPTPSQPAPSPVTPAPAPVTPAPAQQPPSPSPASSSTGGATSSSSPASASAPTSTPAPAAAAAAKHNTSPKKKFTMAQTSKFRHLLGTAGQRSQQIFNIRNSSISVFGECDGFHANKSWAAVPLAGRGGLITVIDVNKPGKLPETGVPTIQNGSNMTDFTWDPFNDTRMAVSCEDAKIRIWSFPAEGFEGTLEEPDMVLRGHEEKIYFIKFHPMASDVLLSASYDSTMKIWDLTTGEAKYSLDGHTGQIFSAAWSPDGKRIATLSKDGQIRIYEPRKSTSPIAQGAGPSGTRGGRIIWVHNGELLLTSGFGRELSREISLYNPNDLSAGQLGKTTIDKNPATLLPCYDPDTHVVFLSGKGERIVTCLEVLKEAPYFLQLAGYSATDAQQALSFLPKNLCVVKDVEFMRALRLTKTTIEPIYFTLPRVKKEFFQDDVFPDTKVRWEPALTGSDWFSGKDGEMRTICLCPDGMPYLSSVPKSGPQAKKYTSEEILTMKTDAEKRDEIMSAMTNKLALKSEPLPQADFEGVEDDEWDD